MSYTALPVIIHMGSTDVLTIKLGFYNISF